MLKYSLGIRARWNAANNTQGNENRSRITLDQNFHSSLSVEGVSKGWKMVSVVPISRQAVKHDKRSVRKNHWSLLKMCIKGKEKQSRNFLQDVTNKYFRYLDLQQIGNWCGPFSPLYRSQLTGDYLIISVARQNSSFQVPIQFAFASE